jgi:excinuclease ABC subunit C
VQILRDRQQKVATAQLGDRDVFGLKVGPSGSAIQVFAMRGGRVVERLELVADPGGIAGRDADVLQAALQQFYEMRLPPAEIDLPLEIEDCEAMEEWLSARAERRVKILVPQRGDKKALVELATRNAELSYRTRFNENTAAHFDALETLRSVLDLPVIPRRIECFDISTIQGSETVASMVVCEDGRMKKSEYRKFRIRGMGGQDDFAAMREVVQRRYRKVLEDGGPFPDLILIDGGKGQLTAAYEGLEQIGLGNLVAAGIAKKEELLFTRHRQDAIALPEHDPRCC